MTEPADPVTPPPTPAIEYNDIAPRAYYKQLHQNAQLALINLAGPAGDPGRISIANKRYYTREEHMSMSEQNRAYTVPNKPWTSGYSMICPVESSTSFPPDVTVSSMVTKSGISNEFFSFGLSSAQKALLVPKIRIFKVEYALVGGVIAPGSQPTAEIEIEFDSYVAKSDIKDMLEGHRGKMQATGIESFDWTLMGVNPGEVDNNIEASLKIYFNSISSLLVNNLREHTTTAGQLGRASFLDLIIFAPPFKGGAASPDPTRCIDREYDGKFFEIRADVGWQVPSSGHGLFNSAELKAIDDANVSLFLQLTDHEFDFKEDGSATLTANYRARSSLIEERFDLLGLNSPGSAVRKFKEGPLKDAQDKVAKFEEARQTKVTPEEPDPDMNEGVGLSHIGTMDPRHKVAIAELEAKEQELQQLLYSGYNQILEELILKHTYACVLPYNLLQQHDVTGEGRGVHTQKEIATFKGPKVYDASAVVQGVARGDTISGSGGKTRVGTIRDKQTDAYELAANKIEVFGPMPMRSNLDYFYMGNTKVGGVGVQGAIHGANNPEQPGAMSSGEATPGGGAAGALEDKSGKGETDDLRPAMSARGADQHTLYDVTGAGGYTKGDDGSLLGGQWVQFFYLGDILEVFLTKRSLMAAVRTRERAFVTTDIEFVNSRLVYNALRYNKKSLPAGGIACGFKGLSKWQRQAFMSIVNIANIPLSVELFLDFMKRKIIATQRTTYYIEDFIQDISNEFVKPIFLQLGLAQPNTGPISSITNVTAGRRASRLLAGDQYLGYPKVSGLGLHTPNMGWDDSGASDHNIQDLLTQEAESMAPRTSLAGDTGNPQGSDAFKILMGGVVTGAVTDQDTPSLEVSRGDLTPAEIVELERAVEDEPPSAPMTLYEASAFEKTDLQKTFKELEDAADTATSSAASFEAAGNQASGSILRRRAATLQGLVTKGRQKLTAQSALKGFNPMAGNVTIARIDDYLYTLNEGDDGDGPDDSDTAGASDADDPPPARKRILVFPPPPPGDPATCDVKIISFQSYFGAHAGDYDTNLELGIPNFVVGLDRGIVKAVNFERVDQPHLREARTSKTRTATAKQLRELYNVTLTLYGNTLLLPGQLIYVEPNRLIFGKPVDKNSLARILGMGGYHLVVDVANEISKDGWETTVKALHVAMPTASRPSSSASVASAAPSRADSWGLSNKPPPPPPPSAAAPQSVSRVTAEDNRGAGQLALGTTVNGRTPPQN